ncbi:MAG: M14 family zinc carboxypeptidase, partial [Longimicrobiales bacterium]
LPASSTVPTPVDVLGHVVGQPDVLHYPAEIYEYMRAVDAASDRVKVVSMGETEEGREMILVIVADEQTIANLDVHKQNLANLADPRITSEEEAQRLIGTTRPIYWATGAIHAPETGSPEMLMELVYRLAVDEGEHVSAIRDNLIFMATPVVEVDGRAKVVDLAMAPRKDPDGVYPTRPLYWGKYVAHDNNRDGMALQLALTRHIVDTFNEWHPTVLHDLHESASYLYTSTGRGPYNAWIDPIVVNEWNRLAFKEVKDMTAWGVPGVYTFDFYDGWAPNYMFWVANMRNSIGRFYETQGSGNASTRLLTTDVDRQWHRPSTPLPEVVWGIRNNVNLQQSALLIALHEVAIEKEEFLRNFWEKSKRSVAKATTEGPAAYVLPANDPRVGQQARLLQLLQMQGAEVHRATAAFTAGETQYGAGSYILRMDQPYSRAVDMLLDKQYYNPDDPRPYDDVGWTLGPLYNAQVDRVEDVAVLSAPMTLVTNMVESAGGVQGTGVAYLIDYNADNNLTAFRYANSEMEIAAAEQAFDVGGRSFRAGSFIIPTRGNPGDVRDRLERAAAEYGFTAYGVAAVPTVATHAVAAPRVAVVHTWQRTQDEGWLRLGLDE